jgi:signal transduction histidine kinase
LKRSAKRLRFLTWMIIVYLIMALVWWSVLLHTKNKESFEAKAVIMQYELLLDTRDSMQRLETHAPYIQLKAKYNKQKYMIYGEGLIFVLTLAIGIWLMNKGFVKEIKLAEQQKNFLLSITHELKSPLAGMKLVMETLKKHNLDEPKRELLLKNGLQDADRLENLVSNLLLAARIDGGYRPILESHSIHSILQEAIQLHKQRFPIANITISGNDRVTLDCDFAGLQTVFKNLFENAEKYSPNHSSITIGIKDNDRNTISISISDKGPGIPDREKNLVFEKFYRIGSEETRRTKGTGLGLYLVKGIIMALGGQIAIEDNPGGGATFIIELPKNQT